MVAPMYRRVPTSGTRSRLIMRANGRAKATRKRAAASEPRVTAEQDTADQHQTAAQEDSPPENEVSSDQNVANEQEPEPRYGQNHALTEADGTPSKMAGVSPLQQLIRQDDAIISVKITNYKEGKINVHAVSKFVGWQLGSFYPWLILPTEPYHFGTTRKLFDSIVTLFEKHVMLPKNECSVLAHWSIATWFTEYLPFVPCLVISGPSRSADLLLSTLAAVCHTPLLLAELNPAMLRKLELDTLGPVTLLLREPQLNQRMAALLKASNQPGYWFYDGERFQQLYCPKCIYVGEGVNRQPIASNSIQLHIGGSSFRPLHLSPTDNVIVDLQNQLLFYRLLNHDKVAASSFRVSDFRPEMCEIAEVLGAAICDDLELQRGVIDVLKDRDEQSRVDRASGLNGVVLRAVLFHFHQNGQQEIFVREIAATVNRMYGEEGESLKVTNEKVGHALKYLGVHTRRLSNAGRGLVFDKPTQIQAHRLGQAYDVLAFAAGCKYCHELQASQPEELVKDV